MIGSPLIVHPLFIAMFGRSLAGAGSAVVVALVVSALAVTTVGLILDRRSPATSTFAYLGIAFGYFGYRVGGGTLEGLVITLLALGSYVVALGLWWRPLRRALVPRLLPPAIVARLPPLA